MTLLSTSSSPASVAPLDGRRVLVVEDEWFLAFELEEALRAAGATVLGPVPSVADAMASLDAGSLPDAAVLDVNLGGEMAYPVADRLLAQGVPLVLATGTGEADVPERLRHLIRLEKPVEASLVVRALEGMVTDG